MAEAAFKGDRVNSSQPAPRVSVLLPNYNYERFLPQALSSVLEQDYRDFELLVSDNVSTDGSAAVIREFAARDSRLRFVRQPEHLNLVAHLNWCLRQARGEYVKFLLADDRLARRDTLGRLVGLIDSDSRMVLASSAVVLINERSEPQSVRDFLEIDLVEEGALTCRRCLLSGVNQIGEPSVFLFRRSCAGAGFNETYQLWVDLEFSLRVLEQGRFGYCSEPLVAFRLHEGQETRNLVRQDLLFTEYYRLLSDHAERPWLGRTTARQRLFEELYQTRKRAVPAERRQALDQALECVGGRTGYTRFLLKRKLCRPFVNLRLSLRKRLHLTRAQAPGIELWDPKDSLRQTRPTSSRMVES